MFVKMAEQTMSYGFRSYYDLITTIILQTVAQFTMGGIITPKTTTP